MTTDLTVELTQRIFNTIYEEQDYQQTLQTLIDLALEQVGRESHLAALFEYSSDGDMFSATAVSGLSDLFLQHACNLPAHGWPTDLPQISDNIAKDSRLAFLQAAAPGEKIQSVLELPLHYNRKVLAVLALYGRTPYDFDPALLVRLTPLAEAGFLALQTANLLQTAQKRAAEAAALNQIAKAVNANLDLETILSLVADEIARLVPHQRASLALRMEHDPAHLRVRPLKGQMAAEQTSLILVSAQEDSGVGIAYNKKRPYIATDLAQTQTVPLDNDLYHSGIRAYVCLPLRHGNGIIGVLNLGSDKPFAFGAHNLPLLEKISEQLAVAIGNARLFAYSQQRAAELDTLNDIGRALAATLDEDRLLDVIYQQTRRVLDTDNLYIALYDDAAQEINFAFQMHEGQRQTAKRRPLGNGITEHIIQTGQSLFLHDQQLDEIRAVGIIPFGDRPRVWLGVPLIYDDQVIGVISVQNYHNLHAYDQEHLRLLQAVANQAAIALQNARLYKAQRDKAAEETARRMVLSAANQTPELKEMLQAILQEVLQVTRQDAGWISLSLTQEQGLEMVASAGVSPDFVQAENMVTKNCHVCQNVLSKQVGCMVQPLSTCPYLPPILVQREGLSSHITVPIVHQGKAIGVLTIAAHNAAADLRPELPLLEAIGHEIGAVVMNAHLYQVVQQEQRKLAAIVDETADLILVLDETERVLLVNNATQKFLRVHAATVTGQPIERLGVPQLGAALQSVRQYGGSMREVSLDDGCVLYASFSPVHNVGWVVVMQDITPLKQLDRLRTEWVASVSHDLKNPVAGVLMSVDLLERLGPLTEIQMQVLQRLRSGAQRLRTLVTDVLDLARLEAGPATHITAVSLPHLIHDALAEVDLPAAAKQHTINTDLPPSLPLAAGDPALLLRVLVNLLSNAIKYTPDEGQILVSAGAGANDSVQITVADTGCGIPETAVPHLFDRFYRVPGSAAEAEGTGLGLNIVKTIIEKHNGRIWVESQLEKGTAFSFTLPLYQKV